ncbi:MAG TPA: signal peptidase I [Gemmatimonadaceae bacterium]
MSHFARLFLLPYLPMRIFSAIASMRAIRRRFGMWAIIATMFASVQVVRITLLEAFAIPSGSMEPTLLPGDYVLVNKAIYGSVLFGLRLPGYADPQRGEVAIFRSPMAPRHMMVKRVIGVPGDVLEMRARQLFVNGVPIEEPFTRYTAPENEGGEAAFNWQRNYRPAAATTQPFRPTRDTWGPIVVPAEHYFVMGDHRSDSFDSRYWGFVARSAFRGRVWIRCWSADPEEGPLGLLTSVRWSRVGSRVR